MAHKHIEIRILHVFRSQVNHLCARQSMYCVANGNSPELVPYYVVGALEFLALQFNNRFYSMHTCTAVEEAQCAWSIHPPPSWLVVWLLSIYPVVEKYFRTGSQPADCVVQCMQFLCMCVFLCNVYVGYSIFLPKVITIFMLQSINGPWDNFTIYHASVKIEALSWLWISNCNIFVLEQAVGP